MQRDIAAEIALMHATEHAQICPQSSPHSFTGVGMRFARPISIRITRPFSQRVANRGMWPLDRCVALVFVGVDVRSWSSKLLHMRAQPGLLGVLNHAQAHLATHSSHSSQDRRPVIGICATSTPLIRSAARRVGRIEMLPAFFPPRSGTFRRSQSLYQARVYPVVLPRHAPAGGDAISGPFSRSVQAHVRVARWIDLGTRHVVARPLGPATTARLRKSCDYRAYRRLGTFGSDRLADRCHGWYGISARQ